MNTLRISVLGLGLVLGLEGQALAQTCTNDTDCPGTTCGGQVCQWMDTTTHSCVPATASDWCTTTADCKCASLGATCNTATNHCSFVTPDGAPRDGGTTRGGGGGCAIAARTGALPGLALIGFAALALSWRRRLLR